MYPPKTQNYLMSVLFWGAGCGVPSSRRAMIFARLRSLLPDSSDPGDPKCNNRRHKYAVHAFLVKDERRILLRVFPDNRIHTCARGINCFTFAAKLSLHTRCPARPLLAKTRHRNGEFEQVHVTRGGYNLFADHFGSDHARQSTEAVVGLVCSALCAAPLGVAASLARCHLRSPRRIHLCAQQRDDAQGVVTGSVLQGMALTVPIGGFTFLATNAASGELGITRYPVHLGTLTQGLATAGEMAEGHVTIDAALEWTREHEGYWCTPELLRIRGELFRLEGSAVAADDH